MSVEALAGQTAIGSRQHRRGQAAAWVGLSAWA